MLCLSTPVLSHPNTVAWSEKKELEFDLNFANVQHTLCHALFIFFDAAAESTKTRHLPPKSIFLQQKMTFLNEGSGEAFTS